MGTKTRQSAWWIFINATLNSKSKMFFYLIFILNYSNSNHYPPTDVKVKYAKALVKLYPILSDGTNTAYVSLFSFMIRFLFYQQISNILFLKRNFVDDVRHRGFLENFLRNKRSYDPLYKTIKRPYKKRQRDEYVVYGNEVDDDHYESVVRFLQNITAQSTRDKETVYKKMKEIEINRFIWFHEKQPTLTDIFENFPKYLNHIELVKQNYINYQKLFYDDFSILRSTRILNHIFLMQIMSKYD